MLPDYFRSWVLCSASATHIIRNHRLIQGRLKKGGFLCVRYFGVMFKYCETPFFMTESSERRIVKGVTTIFLLKEIKQPTGLTCIVQVTAHSALFILRGETTMAVYIDFNPLFVII